MVSVANLLSIPRQSSRVSVYWKEIKYEFLKNLRLRAYSVSTIGFPTMFYILFGLVLGSASIQGVRTPAYLMATYGAFGVMGTSLFGTAAALAAERGLGWLQVKRASPMPPAAYFIGKVVMSMIFSAVVVSILMLLGISFGKVTMAPLEMLRLISVLVAGSLPFCAMGLALGYFIGPNSAPATINMIYLPISFCSGLWVPIMFLPRLMRQAAHLLPPYHLAQVALRIVGGGDETPGWQHWQFLIAFTLVCLGIAYYGFRRDEGKMYG
ncbi:MAG TPA: ABC transporter permease [Terriglobales bacterium]|nr:ABC transporter permease [Terriglobales bacterium]